MLIARHGGHRLAAVFAVSVIQAMTFAGSVQGADPSGSAADTSGYDFSQRLDVPPLIDSREWVLVGTKLDNGACRYKYPEVEEVLPDSGWVVRSIAIDMDKCAKLIEEGVPTYLSESPKGSTVLQLGGESSAAEAGGEGLMALVSTRAAWQKVEWKDFANISVNSDTTEIEWTYNGSDVTSGQVSGWITWNSSTNWVPFYAYHEGFLQSAGDFYRGNTWSKFGNNWFCQPLPTVYTYYYYNRMWGHPGGTATRSQSSDSIDECLRLHFDVYSAYGQYNP